MPTKDESDYYVDLMESKGFNKGKTSYKGNRENLPRMDWMMQQNLIKPEQLIYVKGHENEKAKIIDYRYCEYNNQKMTYCQFGCSIKKWNSIQTYAWLVLDESKKLLKDIREERMNEIEKEIKK